MEAGEFGLYAFWRSSATYRVRVALAMKGLRARETLVDLDAGAQREAWFLAVNPLGGVPALVVPGGAVITQSLAILEYLEEIAPSPALLPADALGRARVRSIGSMLAADTHPLVVPRVRRYLTQAGFDAAAWRAWQEQWFGAGLRAVEARLAGEAATGAYCHGEQVGMADILLLSVVKVMRVFKIAVADTPVIDGIVARCEGLAAFAGAEPLLQPGAPAG